MTEDRGLPRGAYADRNSFGQLLAYRRLQILSGARVADEQIVLGGDHQGLGLTDRQRCFGGTDQNVLGLAELSRSRSQAPPTSPAVVAVQAEPGMLYVLLPALGGLAAGLGLTMVALARRLGGERIR